MDKKFDKPVSTLLEYGYKGVYLTLIPTGRVMTCECSAGVCCEGVVGGLNGDADSRVGVGRMMGATIKGIRDFVEMYEPVDMLFEVLVEGRGTGRVGTGRLGSI